MNLLKTYLVSARKHQFLRYACPKIAHLRKVNSAFSGFASLELGPFLSDTQFSCKHSLIVVFLLVLNIVNSQTIIKGHVFDKQGNSLFAVNVYLELQNTASTITDLDGNFILKLANSNIDSSDCLVFSFIGYDQLKLPFDSLDFTNPMKIILTENTQSLNEVVVEGRKSISKEFSIKQMDKMKIYLSPLAAADPLKAIALLPSSTNANETANPELRGSSANRTKVFLNGVPISNPVRNSQINGIGFFSLFNPALIKNMFVYPSNPPLIYGNSSAGMVDIETEDNLDKNNFQIAMSLASTGICISQKINKKSFLQMFGNVMFSDAYLLTNSCNNHQLKSFSSNDVCLNYHNEISKNLDVNLYSYFVSESSNVLLNLFTWPDIAKAKTIRNFNILNLKYHKLKHNLSFNVGTNFSKSHFSFGNINSFGTQYQAYLSINYKYLISDKLNVQAGLSNEYGNLKFSDDIPIFYYALSPLSPSFHTDTTIKNNLSETYVYMRWKPLFRMILGFGLRKNLNFYQENNPNYLSLQTNLRYNFKNNQSLLFSVGKYNNLTEPNYTLKNIKLLSSKQISLEYLFETKKTNINIAAYLKSETGDTPKKRIIKGFEIFLEHYIFQKLKASISNAFLNSEIGFGEKTIEADNNVGYFLTTTVSYFNAKLFNISVAWSNRQGKSYIPVGSANYNPNVDFYQPIYSENTNTERLGNYNIINLSLNKMFSFKNKNLIVFISVFNLLNNLNPKNIVYNKDYSCNSFEYYQKRSLYFGCVLSFN